MPPGFKNFSVGIKHSGDSSLSPNDPKSSDIKISPWRSLTSSFLISPENKVTLSSSYSSTIMFLKVTIAFGFLSRATTLTLSYTPARLAAFMALRIKGPLPAPKYMTTISSLSSCFAFGSYESICIS